MPRRCESMISYAQSARCRWRLILDYFQDSSEFERCGVCDNCLSPPSRAAAVTRRSSTDEIDGAARQSVSARRSWCASNATARAKWCRPEAGEVEIRFADGETRSFLPSAVKMVRRGRGKLSLSPSAATSLSKAFLSGRTPRAHRPLAIIHRHKYVIKLKPWCSAAGAGFDLCFALHWIFQRQSLVPVGDTAR